NVLKSYFQSLGDSVTPATDSGIASVAQQTSSVSTQKTTTRFNQLMLTAYREFQMITQEMIVDVRKSLQLKVIHGLDMYAKRSIIRNLNFAPKFNREELLFLCDQFYSVLYYKRHGKQKGTDRLNFDNFVAFLTRLTPWGRFDRDYEEETYEDLVSSGTSPKSAADTAQLQKPQQLGERFLTRLFDTSFDTNKDGYVDFGDVVQGLTKLIQPDMMERIDFFFTIHDDDKDGFLNKEEVIQVYESLFFLLRKEEGDKYLNSVSTLLQRAFEIASRNSAAVEETAKAANIADSEKSDVLVAEESNTNTNNDDNTALPLFEGDSREQNLMLPIAAFRELILGDVLLVEYFDTGFKSTFALQEIKYVEQNRAVRQEMMEQLWKGGISWTGGKKKVKKIDGTGAIGSAGAESPEKKDGGEESEEDDDDDEEGYDLIEDVGK
ncbi:hypothetical protein HK100_001690, partial [Physocladia obscura]